MQASARLRLMLLTSVFAAGLSGATLAETLTVTDITTGDGKEITITVPSVEVEDGNLDETTIRAIFAGDIAGSADALAGLNAASITIPEINIDIQVANDDEEDDDDAEPVTTTMSYHDLVLSDVVDGVAATASFGMGHMTSSSGAEGSVGAMTSEGFNIGGLLAVYGLVEVADPTELVTIFDNYSFEGLSILSDEGGCDFGAIEAGAYRARPLSMSLADLTAMSAELEEGDEPSPEQIGTFMRFYADLLTAFESEPSEFDGFSCAVVDDEGNPVDIQFGSMSVGGFADGFYPEITGSDIAIAVEGDGHVGLGGFVFKPMDMNTLIETLKSAPESVDEAWLKANMRKLIPAMDGFGFSDLAIDLPNPDAPDQRIVASIGNFDVTLGNWVNGVPAAFAIGARDIIAHIPPDGTGGPADMLFGAGYENINTGFDFNASWDADAQTVSIDKLAFNGVDIGDITITGVLGNATEQLFDTDENVALVAAMGMTVKTITVDLTDKGAGPKILLALAEQQGQPVDTFRTGVAAIAQATAAAFLAGSDSGPAVGQALADFVKGAPQLSITLTAKSDAGISVPELMAAQDDPTKLLALVDITAAASGEPNVATTEPAADVAEPAADAEAEAAPAEGEAKESDKN